MANNVIGAATMEAVAPTTAATSERPKVKNTAEQVTAEVNGVAERFRLAINDQAARIERGSQEQSQRIATLEREAEAAAEKERGKVGYRVRKLFGRLSPEEKLAEAKIEADKFDRYMVDLAELYLEQKIGGSITKESCDKYLKQGSGEPNLEIEELESKGSFYKLRKNEVFLHQIRARADEIARKVSFGTSLEDAKHSTIEKNKQAKIKADSSVIHVAPLPPISAAAPATPVEATPTPAEAPGVTPPPSEAVRAAPAQPEAHQDPQVEALKAQLAAEKAARVEQQKKTDERFAKMFNLMLEMGQKQAIQQQEMFNKITERQEAMFVSMQKMQQETVEMFTKTMQTTAETMGKALQDMSERMAESQEKSQQATLAAISEMTRQQAESQKVVLGVMESMSREFSNQLAGVKAELKTGSKPSATAETPQAKSKETPSVTGTSSAAEFVEEETEPPVANPGSDYERWLKNEYHNITGGNSAFAGTSVLREPNDIRRKDAIDPRLDNNESGVDK